MFDEKHKRGFSAMAWTAHQDMGPAKRAIGDVMEFHVGGFGVINTVNEPSDGWPCAYATGPVKGLTDREDTKRAWHYEGDFKRCVGVSPVHRLMREARDNVLVINMQSRPNPGDARSCRPDDTDAWHDQERRNEDQKEEDNSG